MAFITEWVQPTGNFTLPLYWGSTYNMVVSWGDGTADSTVTAYNAASATHNYATPGTYQISITGSCGGWYINNNGTIKTRITKVIDWGSVGFTNYGLEYAFYGCSNLVSLPSGSITGAVNIQSVNYMFQNCTALPSSAVSGSIFALFSNVQTARGVFLGCSAFTYVNAGIFDTFISCFTFQSVFQDNINLTSVPNGLFRKNTAASCAFTYVFDNCPKLEINPWIFYNSGEQSTRFLNKSPNFTQCFSRNTFTGIKGTAPDLWNCTYGTGNPIKTNCFYGAGNSIISVSNYYYIQTGWGAAAPPKILEILAENLNSNTLKITANLLYELPETDSLICYVAKTSVGLIAPENIISLTTSDNLTFIGNFPINDGEPFFISVKYFVSGVDTETKILNGYFNSIAQKSTTTINIVSPNYMTPTGLYYLHGSIYFDGYFYGSARGSWTGTDNGQCLIKLKADDYSVYSFKKFYENKNSSLLPLGGFDQIVYCSGFLWSLSGNGRLVRINTNDIDYMIFSEIGTTSKNQPIGTDGTNLFITTDTAVYKINTALLIGSFASYSYTGATTVAIPPTAIISNCSIIQIHPTIKTYCHSICSDNNFIYLAMTTTTAPSGYADGISICHLQKIDKSTMITAADVVIPKSTDDMVQNTEWLFLAPELENINPDIFGSDYGLIAIRKSTLELKYLKALHQEFNTVNELDRQCYGVFYFNNRIIVQLVYSKKSVVLNTDNIENWDSTFPIGGATEAVYSFQKNGVAVANAPNELVIDDNNWVHISTWFGQAEIFKFPLTDIIPEIPIVYNAVSLQNADTIALLQFIDTHFGCSIRCVQDAPGVPTGTTGTAQDQDGNVYDTVVINEKRWMVQNLKTTHFRNGDPVPNITDAAAWQTDEIGAQCAYNNKPANV